MVEVSSGGTFKITPTIDIFGGISGVCISLLIDVFIRNYMINLALILNVPPDETCTIMLQSVIITDGRSIVGGHV